MVIGPVDVTAGSDRFSTCDEIRAALSSFPEMFAVTSEDPLWEVGSDFDRRVLIETGDQEVLALLEILDMAAN